MLIIGIDEDAPPHPPPGPETGVDGVLGGVGGVGIARTVTDRVAVAVFPALSV